MFFCVRVAARSTVTTHKDRKGHTPHSAHTNAKKAADAHPARFDPDAFLARVGEGRSMADYRKNRVVAR